MRITPIRFVRDVEASRAFYAALGLAERSEATSGTWSELRAGGGSLGLHIAKDPGTHDDAGSVALQFTSDEPLEPLAERLAAAGYETSPVTDETFGRFFTVRDPDGYLIQVNEADEELQGLSYEIRESAALKQ